MKLSGQDFAYVIPDFSHIIGRLEKCREPIGGSMKVRESLFVCMYTYCDIWYFRNLLTFLLTRLIINVFRYVLGL